jgi:hypothetical protein
MAQLAQSCRLLHFNLTEDCGQFVEKGKVPPQPQGTFMNMGHWQALTNRCAGPYRFERSSHAEE